MYKGKTIYIKESPSKCNLFERVHQTIGNILRTFKVQDMVLDGENPLDSILASTMFSLMTTVYTIIQYTPAQSVFG